jgi:hypothetical protein
LKLPLNSHLLERELLIYDSHVVVRSMLMTCVDDGMSDEVGEEEESVEDYYNSALERKMLYGNGVKANQLYDTFT